MKLMRSFPPEPDERVTLANWRTPPFNRWAFNHVRELVPSAAIPGSPVGDETDVSCPAELPGFQLVHAGQRLDFPAWLEATHTDAIIMARNGRTEIEYYAAGQNRVTPHIWMSVSKSILGLIAGIVSARGQLDVDAPINRYVPEVAGSAFSGATVRDALDMRVGVRFDEDYQATGGAIIEYRKAQLWDPMEPGDRPTDLRSFLTTLAARDGEHGGRFHYVSPNTDLLGWVLERATGTRYADLVSELLWQPVHARHDAYITVDRLGAPRCAGGVCGAPPDLVRIGRLFATGGASHGKQVVPERWINDIIENGDASAWETGDFRNDFGNRKMHYRSQWYVVRGKRPLVFGLGVFGQHLFIDPAADLVIAKCSSHPAADDPGFMAPTFAGFEAIRSLFD